MRRRKPHGNHKPHSADKCGICAKPRKHKELELLKEQRRIAVLAIEERLESKQAAGNLVQFESKEG